VEPRERVWRVETRLVTPADHRPVLSLFGRVEAPDRVRAAAPVAGRLLEMRVRDGEHVAAGQPLARLDPRDLEPRLAQARAEVDRERLKRAHDQEALQQERQILALAETALERAIKVQSQKFGSESSVDEAREQIARARLAVTLREQSIAEHPARLASLQARLEEAERDAARGEVVAPFEARIASVEAAAGDQLQAGQAILTLYPVNGLYLRAKVPASRTGELRAALAAGERLPARGQYSGRAVTAVLERLSGEAEARGVDALLRLAPDPDVPLGAFVEVLLERPAAAGTVALPFAALHGGDRVFAVRGDRLAAIRVERVGERIHEDGSQVLVRAPELAAGTRVMVTHLPNAVDGLKVETAP
jgi:RND family efflux transporter MFP subunit